MLLPLKLFLESMLIILYLKSLVVLHMPPLYLLIVLNLTNVLIHAFFLGYPLGIKGYKFFDMTKKIFFFFLYPEMSYFLKTYFLFKITLESPYRQIMIFWTSLFYLVYFLICLKQIQAAIHLQTTQCRTS